MSLLNVVDRIGGHRPENFSAPIPTTNTTKVLTIQDGIPYWFSVRAGQPGWYHLSPAGKTATVVEPMSVFEVFEYLENLQRFYVITLFPVNETTWMVSPFNISDANQRGWRNGTPRYMHLVDLKLESLEIVEARRMNSDMLLFHQLGVIVKEDTPDMLFADKIVKDYLQEMERQEIERARAEQRKTEQGRMAEALEFMGAKLVDWTRKVDGYNITWEHQGRRYSMVIDENMRVESAGVCLAHTDHWHSLASIVAVMEDRHHGISDGGYLDEDDDW